VELLIPIGVVLLSDLLLLHFFYDLSSLYECPAWFPGPMFWAEDYSHLKAYSTLQHGDLLISDETFWNNAFYDFARKVIMTAIRGVIPCIGFLLTAQDSFRNTLLSLRGNL
jgi:hypothetical protein